MRGVVLLIRTTLLGGILFLIPIVVLALLLSKALTLARMLVEPLAARLPVESAIGLQAPLLLSVGLLVVFCFITGLLARLALAQKIIHGLETTVLSNLPGYEFIKGIGESLLGVDKQRIYPVVLARFDDYWQIGLQVDRLDSGLVAVYIPNAPNPHSGALYFLMPDRITPTGASLPATLKCLKRIGAGSESLLRGVSPGDAYDSMKSACT